MSAELVREGFGPPKVMWLGLGGIAHVNRLRPLDRENVRRIADSMQEVGLINPITVREQDGTGYWLIAGLHRLEAARLLKWDAIAAIVISADAVKARLAEIDENLMRGELTPAERAIHIAERKALYEAEHPETQHGKAPGSPDGKGKVAKFATLGATRFTADTAKRTGISERAVQLDATRAKRIPKLASVARTSLDKGDELDALAKLPTAKQDELIERAAAGEKVSAKPVAKQIARAEKEQALADKTAAASVALGSRLYGLIYADPPWRFEPYSRETGMDRAADNHYPTMDLDAIKALNVPAADDCALFMWATVPMLPEALDVMRNWGFTYKSHLVWVKDRPGTGYWARNQHELLLIGTKGSVPAPTPGDNPPSAITYPVSRHSEKPAGFADMLERMFPTLPRLEMFCRTPREGWDAWGNEVQP